MCPIYYFVDFQGWLKCCCDQACACQNKEKHCLFFPRVHKFLKVNLPSFLARLLFHLVSNLYEITEWPHASFSWQIQFSFGYFAKFERWFFSDFFELITFLPEFIVTTLVVGCKDFSSWMFALLCKFLLLKTENLSKFSENLWVFFREEICFHSQWFTLTAFTRPLGNHSFNFFTAFWWYCLRNKVLHYNKI